MWGHIQGTIACIHGVLDMITLVSIIFLTLCNIAFFVACQRQRATIRALTVRVAHLRGQLSDSNNEVDLLEECIYKARQALNASDDLTFDQIREMGL